MGRLGAHKAIVIITPAINHERNKFGFNTNSLERLHRPKQRHERRLGKHNIQFGRSYIRGPLILRRGEGQDQGAEKIENAL